MSPEHETAQPGKGSAVLGLIWGAKYLLSPQLIKFEVTASDGYANLPVR